MRHHRLGDIIVTRPLKRVRPAFWLTAALLMCILMGCEKQSFVESGNADTNADGFTFLVLGANTPVNDALRDRLKARLGSEARVRRTPINLDANFPGLLTSHFRDLAELNRQLNWPPRERVEHPVTQLTYRYIDPGELPFDKVVLLYADTTGLPVLLNAYAGSAGASLLASLEDKYGTPAEVNWVGGRTQIWTRGDDRLFYTAWRDQYDRPRHTITIYYVNNLKQLPGLAQSGQDAAASDDKPIF